MLEVVGIMMEGIIKLVMMVVYDKEVDEEEDEEVDQEADDKKNKVVLKEVGHALSGKSNFAKEMKSSDGL